jgi:hypothetical protein
MSTRLADALMSNGDAYSKGRAPMANLNHGGQNGFTTAYGELASTTHGISRPLVCLLIDAPKIFSTLPKGDQYISALKNLVEVHAQGIDGLARGLEVDFSAETAIGNAGEMFQDFVNVTRARSTPSFTWVDLYGYPIQSFLEDWITLTMADPDSRVPGASTISGAKPGDLLSDQYTAIMLFFMPDPTFTKVQRAWLVANMAPKGTGDITGKKEVGAAGEKTEITIEFSGAATSNLGVVAMAQALFDKINLVNANPRMAPAFVQSISADVAAANTVGFTAGVDALANTAILRS